MTGFAGCFALDGAPITPSDLEPMARATAHPPAERRACVRGSFGITIAHAHTAATTLGFDGRLDNREELADACGLRIGDPDAAMPDAALVLAAYDRFDDDFARHLNGDFALALFDARRERVLFARDVMSARPLYYCANGGLLLFATKIRSLLADPRVRTMPDEQGLAGIVLDYWCDEERTCFKGISSVPAGHLIVATRERLERKRHWTFDTGREIRYRSFAEYCDAFRSLFETSVARRLRTTGPLAIGVSGGVDSSSIFCQAASLIRAESLRKSVRGVSLVFPAGTPAAEGEFVDVVERACGVSVVRVPATSYKYLEHADRFVQQLESPGVVAHTQHLLFEAARHAGCDALAGGFFGDQVLADRGYLVDLVRRGRWLKVRHDVRTFHAWTPDAGAGFFERDLRERLVRGVPPRWLYQLGRRVTASWRARSRYPSWFTASFRRTAEARSDARFADQPRFAGAHAEAYFRYVTAGHYTQTVRCETAVGELYGVGVSYPFRDRDLLSFLMAIPGEIVNWQGRPKGLLRAALAGIVPDAVLGRRSKADFTAIENRALSDEQPDYARLLGPDCLAVRAGFVDRRALNEALGAVTSVNEEESATPGWPLTDVVGLELWLRNFFGSAIAS